MAMTAALRINCTRLDCDSMNKDELMAFASISRQGDNGFWCVFFIWFSGKKGTI
jgi:hypothetical protein